MRGLENELRIMRFDVILGEIFDNSAGKYLKKARFLNWPVVPETARSKASSLLVENRPFPFWNRQTIPSSSGILASALQNRNSLSKSIYSDSHRRCISNWRFLHVDF